MATPLSISAFKMATSPSDKDNVKIADWMDCLQSSMNPPSQPCLSRTEMLWELQASHNNVGGGGNNIMENSDKMEEGDETTEGDEIEKLTSALPDAAVPISLLANLSLDKDKGKGRACQDDDNDVGMANKGYFMPSGVHISIFHGHSNTALQTSSYMVWLPLLMWRSYLKYSGVESIARQKLTMCSVVFHQPFRPEDPYTYCNFPKMSISLHNHSGARKLQHYLPVCIVSSWYYDKSEIYPVAMHFAKHAAASTLIDGWKWEEDQSWLYTGLAIRITTDLDLHQAFKIQPTTERQECELLNWIQFHDDVFSDPDSPMGLNRFIDFLTVTLEHDNRLTLYFKEWAKHFNEESDHSSTFQCKLLLFIPQQTQSQTLSQIQGFTHVLC
ncbi:hypothetical protein F5141DRAFT_1252804 [Pisolithus sp. B1]|nr:hypothetical protein F5141DRAFT_1252804 [Pisolithus sp. B1]